MYSSIFALGLYEWCEKWSDKPVRNRGEELEPQLTHRFKLKRRWNLVAENAVPLGGIGLEESQVIDVDIGNLPVLEALKSDGVGGIVGADLLMMCDVVRFSGLNGRSPKMILIKQ